jgi:polar amino acid transport system substrate-binding protein
LVYQSRAPIPGSLPPRAPISRGRAALASGLLAGLAAAGVYALDRPESTLARVRREGVVRVGYAPERPYAFRTPDGRVTGESPELARAVLRTLGVGRVEWVQTEFRALIPELRAGRFDLIAAGMFVTPERAAQIAFSRPTFVAAPALVVRREAAPGIGGLADVRALPAGRVAVLDGAVEERLVRGAAIGDERILRVPDPSTGVEAVRSGRAAAFALSRLTLQELVHERAADLAIVFPLRDAPPGGAAAVGHGAFGFRRDDDDLRAAFDAALARIVGTPAHLRLVAPFGFTAADVPPPATRPPRAAP